MVSVSVEDDCTYDKQRHHYDWGDNGSNVRTTSCWVATNALIGIKLGQLFGGFGQSSEPLCFKRSGALGEIRCQCSYCRSDPLLHLFLCKLFDGGGGGGGRASTFA
jgi:hypothetical protein